MSVTIKLHVAKLSKFSKGETVQLKPEDLDGSRPFNVMFEPSMPLLKRIQSSIRRRKGLRVKLSQAEATSIREAGAGASPEEVEGGKLKVKSLKQLNRETSRKFKQFGEDLKRVPKYYRNNIREYTSPIAKSLIQDGIPMIGQKLVEEGMKSVGADPFSAKLVGMAAKEGLKKPSKMAYKKSGLGIAQEMKKARKVATKGIEFMGSGVVHEPITMDGGRKRPVLGGRIPARDHKELMDPIHPALRPEYKPAVIKPPIANAMSGVIQKRGGSFLPVGY